MEYTRDDLRVGELLAPEFMELLDQKRTSEAREALLNLFEPQIADLLIALPPQQMALAFRLLPRQMAADVFTLMPEDHQQELLEQMSHEQLAQLFDEMPPDDRAQLFEEMPGQVAARVLSLMNPAERRKTQIILGYPPESVGRIMTPDYVTVRPEWTVQQAMEHIRRYGRDAETINTLYVVNDHGVLVDDVRLRQLILANPQQTIESLMDDHVISLSATEDREAAVKVMSKYDLPVLPVVDSGGILVGIVTFDDVADVAQEETTEDFHKGAAVAPLTMSYREATVRELFQKRIGWLIILVFLNLVSSGVIAAFEETLAAVIALAFFIPLLIDSGGNTGSQAATLMVRAIATGDVRLHQWLKMLSKELVVGLSLGLAMGLASSVLGVFRGGWQVGVVVGLSMIFIVLAANLIGMILPFILTRMRLDPAVASSPLITTIADATGLIIYFTLATTMLPVMGLDLTPEDLVTCPQCQHAFPPPP